MENPSLRAVDHAGGAESRPGVKMHRGLAEASVETLREVFERGAVAERALERLFRSRPRWGKRDRNFVAGTVFEVVRHRRRLEFLAGGGSVEALCGAHWTLSGCARPDWAFWPECSLELLTQRQAGLPERPRAVRESVPDWLDALMAEQRGEAAWEAELAAMNRPAPVFLRVNTLNATPEAARKRLAAEGIETESVPGAPDALRVAGERRLPARLLEDGMFEIQDAGSQLVAPFLRVEPGARVIDACAGAGGKTLHLAALMKGRGEIRAFDVNGRKLDILRNRARAAGAGKMIRAELLSDAAAARHRAWADRLLIDAPCSGLGTLRRQPDLKWRLSPASLEATRNVQREVLIRCAPMLKPGGLLVYATCSLLPAENERQTEWFLERRNGEFEWLESRVVSPAADGFDGFYMALLRRVR